MFAPLLWGAAYADNCATEKDMLLLQTSFQAQLDELRAEMSILKGDNEVLKRDNDALQRRLQEPSGAAPVARVGFSPLGEEEEERGRRLSTAAVCCRWTPGGTCTSGVTQECSMLHEYVEDKVATHEFADINACLTSTQASWTGAFDGVDGNVSLNNAYRFPTPLKVRHAVCACVLQAHSLGHCCSCCSLAGDARR